MKAKNLYLTRGSRGLGAIVAVTLSLSLYISPAFSQGSAYKETMTQPPVTFFAGNQDIPVMPGLIELEGRSFSYDKPEGEITEIVARLEGLNPEQVLYYYEVTLPQFGWNRVIDAEGAHYFRKEEYLDIAFDEEEGSDLVKILIHPSR